MNEAVVVKQVALEKAKLLVLQLFLQRGRVLLAVRMEVQGQDWVLLDEVGLVVRGHAHSLRHAYPVVKLGDVVAETRCHLPLQVIRHHLLAIGLQTLGGVELHLLGRVLKQHTGGDVLAQHPGGSGGGIISDAFAFILLGHVVERLGAQV